MIAQVLPVLCDLGSLEVLDVKGDHLVTICLSEVALYLKATTKKTHTVFTVINWIRYNLGGNLWPKEGDANCSCIIIYIGAFPPELRRDCEHAQFLFRISEGDDSARLQASHPPHSWAPGWWVWTRWMQVKKTRRKTMRLEVSARKVWREATVGVALF